MLSSTLIAAASCLEARFDCLDIPTKRVPLDQWQRVPAHVRSLLPLWLPELLDRFRLSEGTLVVETHSDKGLRAPFSLCGPAGYAAMASQFVEDPLWVEFILERGFVPISGAPDGDCWLTHARGGCESPIFYHSLTSLENFYACGRLSDLLASAAVEDYSRRYPKSRRLWPLRDEYRALEVWQKLSPHDGRLYDDLIWLSRRMENPEKVEYWERKRKENEA
jgi:hypothetical protein